MHSLNHHTTDRSAADGAARSHVFTEQLLDQLADDLIALSGVADARQHLLERGWEPAFLDSNVEAARVRANKRFMRGVDEDPAPSLDTRLTEMAGVISSLMPPAQVLIAELQSRGFTKRHIDLLFNKARAKASLAFCHGKAGEMH